MKRIPVLAFAAAIAAGVTASMPFAAGGADQQASPIYGVTIPEGYRDWTGLHPMSETREFL